MLRRRCPRAWRIAAEHRAALLRLQASLLGAESALQDTGLAELPAERSIGPYRLVRRLGEGGFGVVWLAEQQEPLQRLVALKLVRLGMHSAGVLRRFESERELLARFDHPHIARVLDAGEAETGCPYLVTEYVPGEAITQFCSEQALSVEARLELFVRVCDGVQHAHQRGVMHRDLKPSNVLATLLDGVPTPKIIDFGIARAVGGEAGPGATRAGTLVGTPEYMSPEQAQGNGDVDIRTDVFALGVMLFELLVGDLPQGRVRWRTAGLSELVAMIRHEPAPRPSTKARTNVLARQLRTDLDWVVLKALAKDREHRYGTVA
ncbi:MAG: serine/threonine-protein kinase, partial [Planctomycetota bacterium]